MDPFTIALATFGVQKLRGKSTNRALRDGLIAGGIGQLGAMTSAGQSIGLQGFGQIGAGQLAGGTLGAQFQNTQAMQGIGALFGKTPETQKMFTGIGDDPGLRQGLVGNEAKAGNFFSNLMPESTAGRIGLGAAGVTLLGGMGGEDEGPQDYLLPTPNKAYTKFAKSGAPGTPTGFMTRDYTTGVDTALEDPATYKTVEEILGDDPTQTFKKVAYNSGGIVNIAKFNEGGQALPSKFSHDENDMNNYTRAGGFVKDGAGMGDENEDTMLAQLADGEFVSRAAAVRGAGIVAGANINNKEEQRKVGAEFFYEQQKRFKRIYDLIDASSKNN
jgi:hypothetical protein